MLLFSYLPRTSRCCRLTYFEGRGLGERIRCLLAEAGVEYEDRILTKEMMAELRETGQLLFQQVPLLEIDGLKLVQSGAIVRYLARKYNLYGSTAEEAVQCDMLYDGLNDLMKVFLGYVFQKDKPAYATEKMAPALPRYLKPMNDALMRNNNGEEKGFLLGDRISFPDFLLLEVLEYVNEILPSHLTSYPLLVAFRKRMLDRPTMKQFYSSGLHRGKPDDRYAAHVSHVLGWN